MMKNTVLPAQNTPCFNVMMEEFFEETNLSAARKRRLLNQCISLFSVHQNAMFSETRPLLLFQLNRQKFDYIPTTFIAHTYLNVFFSQFFCRLGMAQENIRYSLVHMSNQRYKGFFCPLSTVPSSFSNRKYNISKIN